MSDERPTERVEKLPCPPRKWYHSFRHSPEPETIIIHLKNASSYLVRYRVVQKDYLAPKNSTKTKNKGWSLSAAVSSTPVVEAGAERDEGNTIYKEARDKVLLDATVKPLSADDSAHARTVPFPPQCHELLVQGDLLSPDKEWRSFKNDIYYSADGHLFLKATDKRLAPIAEQGEPGPVDPVAEQQGDLVEVDEHQEHSSLQLELRHLRAQRAVLVAMLVVPTVAGWLQRLKEAYFPTLP